MAALERAALEFGNSGAEPVKRLPKKSKTVAVIGGGISGLTVAHDLARKGWGVVIFEAGDRLGGGLWKSPPDLLPRDVLVNDLKIIAELEIEVRLNMSVAALARMGTARF